MQYDELLSRLANATGVPKESIREVLYYLPDVLVCMQEGEITKTPLGVFKAVRKRARLIVPPKQTKHFPVKEEIVIKIRSGLRLRKDT